MKDPSLRATDNSKKRRLNFHDNTDEKDSAGDNNKQRENPRQEETGPKMKIRRNQRQDDMDSKDEDIIILDQYKTSREEDKENKKSVHKAVEVDYTGQAVYCTSPQRFIITFSYSLSQQLLRL